MRSKDQAIKEGWSFDRAKRRVGPKIGQKMGWWWAENAATLKEWTNEKSNAQQ